QILEGYLHSDHRRRSAGRLGSCQRLSHDGLRRQRLHEAPRRHQHAIQPDYPAAHDGTDSRPAANEPVRCNRHTDINPQYNQTSLLRTMALMLGLPPMTKFNATATPMFDCFTNKPDFSA